MDRFIARLAIYAAGFGGVVLCALILMTGASIVGRALTGIGLGPVTGDYELVEIGIALAVFCFLPYAQLKAGHATVDIFTSGLSVGTNRVLIAIWEIVMALAMALIAWRLYEGLLGKIANGETTYLLQIPLWWAFAASLVPAIVAVIVAVWSAFDRVRAALTGNDTRAHAEEAGH